MPKNKKITQKVYSVQYIENWTCLNLLRNVFSQYEIWVCLIEHKTIILLDEEGYSDVTLQYCGGVADVQKAHDAV